MATHPLPTSTQDAGSSNEDAGETRSAPAPERGALRPFHVGALFVVLLLLLWNNAGSGRPFTPSEEEADAYFSIFLAAEAVNAFRDSTGNLPTALAPLGADEEGFDYWTDGDLYSLTFDLGDYAVAYQSGEALLPYATAYDRVVLE